jgi:hypothetical protein
LRENLPVSPKRRSVKPDLEMIPPDRALLVGCAAALVVLVHAVGWIWPLKLAAVAIPIAALLIMG